MKRYYIAYGSNLNMLQMRMRCKDARAVGTATLEGWQLLFKGSKTGAYLTIEKAEGYSVPVGVWAVSEADEKALDRYEGFPTFYYKKEMHLQVKGIKTGNIYERDCFVYIMHEEREIGVPSSFYTAVCAEGYRNFKFDLNILFEAIQHTREVMVWKR